jgi:hypothetical protein
MRRKGESEARRRAKGNRRVEISHTSDVEGKAVFALTDWGTTTNGLRRKQTKRKKAIFGEVGVQAKTRKREKRTTTTGTKGTAFCWRLDERDALWIGVHAVGEGRERKGEKERRVFFFRPWRGLGRYGSGRRLEACASRATG